MSMLMWLSVFIIILNPFSNEDYLALTTDVQVKNYSAQHEKKTYFKCTHRECRKIECA